ncbi:hypothetical protein [Enterococcus cecorum]|nr:hypothetical protein [Enterococcus cecorum]
MKLGKGEAVWVEDEIGVGYLLGAYDSMYQEDELGFDLNDLENLRDLK